MYGIPTPARSDEQVTGLSCPDCSGVLNVMAEGPRETLRFRCRVDHAYSAEEVVVGTERRLEESLWSAIAQLEEIAVMLRELVSMGKAGAPRAGYEERARRAADHGRRLREIIGENAPTPVERPSKGAARAK